jgi:phosphatidylglycerophosphate synthase
MVERVHSGPAVGLLGQLILLFVLSETVGLGAVGWLVGTACGVVTAAGLSYGMTLSGRLALGAANRVTLLRATLVGGVAAMLSDALLGPTNLTVLVGLAAVALVLDGVDGWVARHTGTTSALGARFDMEVDAFLILALSVYVAQLVGPWVLVIGAARYAFWAAGRLAPWMATPLPLRYWRKPVAAIQGIVLTAAVAGLLPTGWTTVTIVIALLLLTESFGRDVLWQWRQHGQPAPQTRVDTSGVLVGGRTQG